MRTDEFGVAKKAVELKPTSINGVKNIMKTALESFLEDAKAEGVEVNNKTKPGRSSAIIGSPTKSNGSDKVKDSKPGDEPKP